MKSAPSANSISSRCKETLREKGYLITHQRELILDQLLAVDSHFDIEEFFQLIRNKKIPVSRATLYRTIACLEKIGCIRKTNFDEAHAHFEIILGEKVHHEHLVCQRCGAVTEFSYDHLEKHIQTIAKSHGFRISSHSLEIFGVCAACRSASEG
jgi:Fur family ferric uptake transcriptional regulator